MKRHIFLFFYLSELLFFNNSLAQKTFSGLPFINNYSPDQYKGGIQNWQINQDKRGIIYIANNFGLLEFDGTEWYNHPVRNGTKLRTIGIESNGRIYTGSQGDFGYFFPDGSGHFQYTSLADSLSVELRNIDETWKIFLNEGKVYFCTFSNIYIYEEGKIHTVKTKLYLEPSFFINKKLYLQSPGNPLMTLDKNNALSLVSGGDFFRDKLLTGILPYRKNQLLITTKNSGIYIYDGINVQFWLKKQIQILDQSTINCAIRLRDGTMAFGTQSNGLVVLDQYGNMLLHLDINNGLASNTVLSLYQDKSDNLWTGLNNGISHIELATPFTLISHDMGVEGTGYAAFAEDDNLYLGTNIGLFISTGQSKLTSGDQIQQFSKINNSDGQVYSLNKIRNTLFMGHHSGAYSIKNQEANHISSTGAWTFIMSPNIPEKVLLGTYSGISFLKKANDHWEDFDRLSGLYESSRVMELDDDDNLWMTHGYKGAFKIKIDFESDSIVDVKFYNSNHGFPSDLLINVFKIKNELLFTAERGVYKYDNEKDIFNLHPTYTEILGPNIHIRDMDEDPLGNVYFITNDQCGVIKYNGANDFEVDYNSFNKIPKLLNDDLVNVNALDINNILFGGKEGFIHYEPNKKINTNDAFSMLIRKVHCTTNGDSVIFDGNFKEENKVVKYQPVKAQVELPYKNNDLRFTFSSTFYEGMDDMQYRFYLKEFDNDWSAWNYKTEKEYTNLPEGLYEFMVMSKNIYGMQSNLASYKFVITPPWFRSYFAYLVYVLSGLFVLVIGMVIVDRKHKKDKIHLKKDQEKELTNKETQLRTVKEQKENEISRLRNEKLNAELNHKNTELASVTMHLLTKNELIGGIKNKLNGTLNQEDKREIKKNITRIIKEINQNANLDKDWEQFEVHFDRVHRDFNKRLKEAFPELTPQEMKLCAYLRLNFTTKEIAQLLHISVRGVEISRYRLRKKLKLTRNENLSEYILEY